MLRLINIFNILCLCILLTNCSSKIKKVDERYTDGKLKYEGSYEHDFFGKTKHGEWIYYYSDGKIKTTGHYKDGHESGKWFYYNIEGQLERIFDYDIPRSYNSVTGNVNEIQYKYFDDNDTINNKIRVEDNYINSFPVGNSGRPGDIEKIESGLLYYTAIYNLAGQIKSDYNYSYEERDSYTGPKYSASSNLMNEYDFYENGQIKKHVEFYNFPDHQCFRCRKVIYYYKTGQTERVEYLSSKEDGSYKGGIVDIPRGKWTYYNLDGTLHQQQEWSPDILIDQYSNANFYRKVIKITTYSSSGEYQEAQWDYQNRCCESVSWYTSNGHKFREDIMGPTVHTSLDVYTSDCSSLIINGCCSYRPLSISYYSDGKKKEEIHWQLINLTEAEEAGFDGTYSFLSHYNGIHTYDEIGLPKYSLNSQIVKVIKYYKNGAISSIKKYHLDVESSLKSEIYFDKNGQEIDELQWQMDYNINDED